MADDEGAISNSTGNMLQNTMARMEARIAALEARNGAEIAGLKRDTEMIRSNMHEYATTMQQFIGAINMDRSTVMADRIVMQEHIKECARRAARQEWYGRAILAGLVGLLGFLLKAHFFPGM